MNAWLTHTSCYVIVVCGVVHLFASEARAELEFTSTILDKGEVRAGPPLSHRFTFTNQGSANVEITEIQTSCGCLTPQLSRRQYSPGEKGSVVVEINTLSPTPGPHAWQVKLTCRVGDTIQEIPLVVKARLIREILVEPAAVTMYVDSPIQSEIRLTDLRSQPLSIEAVDTSAPGLQARLVGEEPDASGRLVRKIQLQVKDDFPEGRHEEALRIYSNDPNYREIKVPVTIVKRPRQRVSATPGRIELTAGPGRPSPARMVLIRDRENQDVELEAVTSDNPAISCQWAKGPGFMTTVKIKVDHNRTEGPIRPSTVQIHVVKPIRQILEIPVILRTQ